MIHTTEQTGDQVAGHEDFGEFVIVMVIDPPDWSNLTIKVLPEIIDGSWDGVIVGIETFPVFR